MRATRAGADGPQTPNGGWCIETPMRQSPFLLRQAASNARRISGPAFSRSAAEAIRTSKSPVPR